MRISFDFDHTLSQESVKCLAEVLINDPKNEIYIITARMPRVEWNKDLFSVAKCLGIPKENIIFTEGSYKWEHLKKLKIDMHFDDDYLEIENARKNEINIPIIHIYDSDFYD